jgi:hypothetical protein
MHVELQKHVFHFVAESAFKLPWFQSTITTGLVADVGGDPTSLTNKDFVVYRRKFCKTSSGLDYSKHVPELGWNLVWIRDINTCS